MFKYILEILLVLTLILTFVYAIDKLFKPLKKNRLKTMELEELDDKATKVAEDMEEVTGEVKDASDKIEEINKKLKPKK